MNNNNKSKFVNINDFDINKFKVKELEANDIDNKNPQFNTFCDYENESFVFMSDIYSCKWNPISKLDGNFVPTDDRRFFFKLYECDELKNLFNKINLIDNYLNNNKQQFFGNLKNYDKMYKYMPIIKSKVNLDDDDDDDDSKKIKNNNNKSIYNSNYIKIKFKRDKNDQSLKTKIMKGEMVNNKYNGQKQDIKTITDLYEIFKYNCNFRFFFKIKKIWFNKSKSHDGFRQYSASLECVRLDIIDNNINVDPLDSYEISNNYETATINGEKKKILNLGNGYIKILDNNQVIQYEDEKNNNNNEIKKPTKNNIIESNTKIMNILNNK